MWRPKDWECKYLGKKANKYFELGADAVLEALRKGATRVNNLGDLPQGKGVIVFIPEEKE